jgi:peptidoglycan/LPS O-acetylase OafA/YrhL
MLRRIGSVLLGFIVILLLVGVTDAILEKLFPAQFVNPDGSYAIPGLPLVAFIIGCVFVYAGVGGYLTARTAQQSPLSHALALGALLLLVSLVFAFANPQQQPWWYLLTSTVSVVLGCLAGGSLKARSARAPT